MKHIVFKAQCELCNWESGWHTTVAKAQKAAKTHTDNHPHGDYNDIPLWDGPLGTGPGVVANIEEKQ